MKKGISLLLISSSILFAQNFNVYNSYTLKEYKQKNKELNNCIQKSKTLEEAKECSYPAPKSTFVKERTPEEEDLYQKKILENQKRIKSLILKSLKNKF